MGAVLEVLEEFLNGFIEVVLVEEEEGVLVVIFFLLLLLLLLLLLVDDVRDVPTLLVLDFVLEEEVVFDFLERFFLVPVLEDLFLPDVDKLEVIGTGLRLIAARRLVRGEAT